jgi:hypothetical protein
MTWAVHGLHQILASGGGRQVELRIQGVELEHIMMERTGGRARSEIYSWRPAASSDAWAVASPIGWVARGEAFRQTLGGSGDVEGGPCRLSTVVFIVEFSMS